MVLLSSTSNQNSRARRDNLYSPDLQQYPLLLVGCSHCFQYINSAHRIRSTTLLVAVFYGFVCLLGILIGNYLSSIYSLYNVYILFSTFFVFWNKISMFDLERFNCIGCAKRDLKSRKAWHCCNFQKWSSSSIFPFLLITPFRFGDWESSQRF